MESEQDINLLESKEVNKNLITPDLVLEWKKYYLREGHSVHSTVTYFNYIKRFVGYGINVNQKTVDKFRNKNMSGACSGALKNFFNFLVNKKEYPIEVNFIKFDKSKSTKKFPKSISILEVKKIVDSIQDLKNKNLTLTIFELGLRISEALKLKWSDFNWIVWIQDKSKMGSVNLINTKGGKFRSIPVSSELMNKLYNEHSNKSSDGIPIGGLLFDFGISNYQDKNKSLQENQYDYIVTHAEDRYRKLLYKVSKECLGKVVNPHMLRHSKAQDMMNNNVPIESIKSYLGHSRISSTEIYAQASAEKLKNDLQEYNEKKESSLC